FVMEHNGKYRLQFTSSDGERSEETLPFDVKVLPDQPPQVEVIKPAQSQLPVNGTLAVTGRATDDFGLTAARLVLSLKTAADAKSELLPPIPYRGGMPLRLADGAYIRSIDLKEVAALEKLTDVTGRKLDLRPGMMLEYS